MATTVIDHETLGQPTAYFYPFAWLELARALCIGEIVGLGSALLASPIHKFIIEPFFCQNNATGGICSSQPQLAFGIGLILTTVLALLVLASLQSYQPLLNAVAPMIALWGVDQYLSNLSANNHLAYYIFVGVLFALAYGLFYLLLRTRHLLIGLAIIIAIIVALRLQF